MHYGETMSVDKLGSGVSYSAVGCEFRVNVLNKVSLNRNAYQTSLSTDQLMKRLCPEASRNLTLNFP